MSETAACALVKPPGNRLLSKFKKSWHKNYIVYIVLIPIMIHFLVLILFPILFSFIISFTNWSLMRTPRFIGLEYWIKLFDDKLVWKSLGVTLEYSLYYIIPVIAFSLFLASLLNTRVKGISVFKGIYFLPYITSIAILAAIWKYLFQGNEAGIINSILGIFGVEPVLFFANRHLALMALALLSILQQSGMYMVYLLGALKGIPRTFYEAAEIDGATRMGMFWRVTVPLIRPTLLYVVILTTISSFQVFETAYMLTMGGPYYGTTTIVYMIYHTGFTKLNMGYGSAISYLLFVIILIISIIQYKVLDTDITYD